MYVRYYIHVSLKNKFYFSERDFYVVLPTNKLETENIVCFSISKKAIYAKINMVQCRGFIKVLNRRATEFDTRAKNWQGPPGLAP